MNRPLWNPSQERIQASHAFKFIQIVNEKFHKKLHSFEDLYEWSIQNSEAFWSLVWDYCGIISQTKGERVLVHAEDFKKAQFFPDAQLNYAENLLRRRDDSTAIIFNGEDKARRTLTYYELYQSVAACASAMRSMGIKSGDRVASYLPNMPETIVFMLAAASIGAVFSSCSPDFGVAGVLDRFIQIEPKLLVVANGYFYNNSTYDIMDRNQEIVQQLPTLEKVVVIPYTQPSVDVSSLDKAVVWDDFIQGHGESELVFEQLPFNHPLFIMFSSGTTGVPKCIVHSAGGTLIQHMKEHQLHTDIHPNDRVFYFTTCGWMMWNWQVSALASKATLVLYDGSPLIKGGKILINYADEMHVTMFGTSAKYIDALAKLGIKPMQTHNLESLRTIASTGSPLSPESFDYVYENIKQDVCLSSISGGTDIVSCFALGNSMGPVWRGELQSRGLGMAVDVFDDQGHSIRHEKGELVCKAPFPSRPIGFWNDESGEKYHHAYYARFDNIWCHGDFVELTPHHGVIIYGRSDAILNPGGVRIGTAEIYRQVEKIQEVLECFAIGQDWNHDVRVVLFVKLRDGLILDNDLKDRIKHQIKVNTTARHVPSKIIQVPDIPKTKNGKIVELAVREIIHQRPVKNKESLMNPESLAFFENIEELQS